MSDSEIIASVLNTEENNSKTETDCEEDKKFSISEGMNLGE